MTCDDGGATSAAINAAGLALVDAGIFLRGVVAAARVGAPVAATTLVDPNRAEARHGVALDLACLPCFGGCWTDLTGERPLQPDAYDSLIARALDAASKVGEQLATAAQDHVARLDAVRGGVARGRGRWPVGARELRVAAVVARERSWRWRPPACRRSPGAASPCRR